MPFSKFIVSDRFFLRGKDLTGKVFGRLTAISRKGPARSGSVVWLCLCECGKEWLVTCNRLTQGTTKSCGCLARESARASMAKNSKNPFCVDSPVKYIFNVYKYNARRRGVSFELTLEDFVRLLNLPCSYCGTLPENKSTYPSRESRHGRAVVVYSEIE